MILGLDISTSITGFTILDEAGDTLLCDHIDLKKFLNLYTKADRVENILKDLFVTYNIQHVWIEESLQMFSSGMSSAKTLSTLSKFNGIISWIVWKEFRIFPEHIAAVSARKEAGIIVEKGKRGKDCVMDHMLDKEHWFVVEYTKTGKIKPYCYDRADSFIIAQAGFLRCTKEKN